MPNKPKCSTAYKFSIQGQDRRQKNLGLSWATPKVSVVSWVKSRYLLSSSQLYIYIRILSGISEPCIALTWVFKFSGRAPNLTKVGQFYHQCHEVWSIANLFYGSNKNWQLRRPLSWISVIQIQMKCFLHSLVTLPNVYTICKLGRMFSFLNNRTWTD